MSFNGVTLITVIFKYLECSSVYRDFVTCNMEEVNKSDFSELEVNWLFNRRGISLASAIVAIAVAIVVGAAMIPAVLNSTNATAMGVTGSNATLLNLVPTIFILVLLIGGAMELVSRVK